MKIRAVLVCVLAMFALAAAPPAPVSTITMIGSNPTFAEDGSLLTAPVQAMFMDTVVQDDQKFTAQSSVSWDGTDRKKTVTFDGVKASYYQVTMLAAAIATQEKTAQAAAAAKAKSKAAKPAP